MCLILKETGYLFVVFFIDGTVEGTDISLSDGNYFHDHTYYGNGCENEWGPGGSGGSTKACSANKVVSFDNEEQGIGVYYDYQAATSGTGAAITAGNTDSPDTFCPLGWQSPYSGTGGDYYDKSRSWGYLFELYHYENNNAGQQHARSYPLSYSYSGFYRYDMGQLYNLSSNGFFWSSTISVTSGSSYALGMFADTLGAARSNSKLGGFNLRCV